MKLWSPKEQHLRKHVRTPEITCTFDLPTRTNKKYELFKSPDLSGTTLHNQVSPARRSLRRRRGARATRRHSIHSMPMPSSLSLTHAGMGGQAAGRIQVLIKSAACIEMHEDSTATEFNFSSV
jgi:hypothetical protein